MNDKQYNTSAGEGITSLPTTGFLKIRQVLQLIPMATSSWYAGIAAGRYPAPIKLSQRSSAWKCEDIRALIAKLGGEA